MISIRDLHSSDYEKGYCDLLSQLTTVGPISKDDFDQQLKAIQRAGTIIRVIERDNTIIGTATLFLEDKFIHQCGRVGHIEDVVVHSQYRKLNYGRKLIEDLVQIAKDKGCYKVILNCSICNQPFYEKCGFTLKGIEMALYFN